MKRHLFYKSLLILVLIIGSFSAAYSTHLRAGEITVTQNCPSRTFTICLNIYVNTDPSETDVKFGGGELKFGDGTSIITEEKNSTVFGDPQDFVGYVQYCVVHTFPAPGQYKISYYEVNRNADILNMSNSVGTSFFIESIIEIDPFKGCNNSPRLLVPPIDKACTGAAWFHNPGAYDLDGDSLSYKMIIPRQTFSNGVTDVVGNYTLPNNQTHYAGIDYNNAQEDGSGRPTFEINPIDGTITWDAPGEPGEYNIAFLITEWRKVNDIWLPIGSLVRDMQIIVEDCKNQRPELIVPIDTCVIAGTKISVPVYGRDPDFDDVKIEVFSQTLTLNSSPADYSPKNVFQKTKPQPAQINFTWQTNCSHIKQQPYQVVFKITDRPAKGVKLVSFETWNITVVGPPPEWNTASIGPNRSGQLKWDPYTCVTKADSMQIWRRIDSVQYDVQNCVTGMPAGLGYEKLKTVPIGQTNYLDTNNGKGLPPGAVVCYRLVAQFPPPFGNRFGGSESIVSDEICLGPIIVDAPVMTNVTVDTTNTTKGRITVRWTPPFEVDPAIFPPPYKYDIYRATGFSGNEGLTRIGTAKQVDTFLIDRKLNTAINVYNYRVMAYDNTGTLVDTSATASSVKLLAKSLLEKIELTWVADVPWSLRSAVNPKHVIYRGSEGDKEGSFIKIAEVESSIGLLKYTDDGSWEGKPLTPNKTYCYRVETRGSYGFDDTSKIPDPLINFSQIVCAQPNDDVPPCMPELVLESPSCEDQFAILGCSFNDFKNILSWTEPTDKTCLDDISLYRIYYSDKINGIDSVDYKLLVELNESQLANGLRDDKGKITYIDRDLPSFARCYRVAAVDRSGNESEWSNEICNDNCPNYQLPNVFTPGYDDTCNRFFSAYSDRSFVIVGGSGEDAEKVSLFCDGYTPTGDELKDIRSKCPRFVLRVEAKIVDRWGKQVYAFSSKGRDDIYIDWDGRDSDGKELGSGIYYYSAKVTYETLDPKDRIATIKGWVHLIRTN